MHVNRAEENSNIRRIRSTEHGFYGAGYCYFCQYCVFYGIGGISVRNYCSSLWNQRGNPFFILFVQHWTFL